jgi:spore coat protein A
MKFVVVPLASTDTSRDHASLTLPAFNPLGTARNMRQVSLNEEASTFRPSFVGPIAALLGTLNAGGNPVPMHWDDRITENAALNSIEIWELYNFTEDAQPIQSHEVQFQLVDRQPFGGTARSPESWETGFKDTVIAYPGELTRVRPCATCGASTSGIATLSSMSSMKITR